MPVALLLELAVTDPRQRRRDGDHHVSAWRQPLRYIVSAIYNVRLTFWGKVGEFFVGDSSAFHSTDFLKGQTWELETVAGVKSVELDEAVPYFDFIDGTKDGQPRMKLNERDAALAAAKSEAAKLWQGAEQRREQHRALKK